MARYQQSEYYKLYSASLRRHVETRAPYLEASNASIEELRKLEAWKHRPSVITDKDGRIVETNQIDVEHTTQMTCCIHCGKPYPLSRVLNAETLTKAFRADLYCDECLSQRPIQTPIVEVR